MKLYNYILAFLSMAALSCMVFFLTCSSSTTTSSEETEENPVIKSFTNSAPIPSSVAFCGKQIPLDRLDIRERFDREINACTYLHSTTMLYLKRANRYFPVIEPILKENGIPDDFKYLCIVESGLDTRALSTAKAAGLWQFMEATGKQYGLEITSQVDERYHIEKSTRAACAYLKDAYSRYGDWVNVAASYNGGMGRISGNIRDQYVDSAFDMHLVSETSRYVFRILAIKEVFSNPWKYGFVLYKEDLYPFVAVEQVRVTSTIDDLAYYAKEKGINYMLLKEYNVWLRDTQLKLTPGKTYYLAIPKKEDLYYDVRKIKVHDPAWIRHR